MKYTVEWTIYVYIFKELPKSSAVYFFLIKEKANGQRKLEDIPVIFWFSPFPAGADRRWKRKMPAEYPIEVAHPAGLKTHNIYALVHTYDQEGIIRLAYFVGVAPVDHRTGLWSWGIHMHMYVLVINCRCRRQKLWRKRKEKKINGGSLLVVKGSAAGPPHQQPHIAYF